jgi:hypothetical protein
LRNDLYEALRTSTSKARALGLLPTAQAIDQLDGGSWATQAVRATAARDLARRAPLVAGYLRLLHAPEPPPAPGPAVAAAEPTAEPTAEPSAEIDRFVDAVRRAHDPDLLLGTLSLIAEQKPAHLDELERLARSQADPWFIAIADGAAAARALAAHDPAAAERHLTEGDKRCVAARADYRCAFLEAQLAELYTERDRLADARSLALTALARARSAGVDPRRLERRLFGLLAEIARRSHDEPLMRAYQTEAQLRFP